MSGDITVNAGDNTDVAFKNCEPFLTFKTEINDVFVDKTDHIYITMPMRNLIEYSDNYSFTSASLWKFKRDEAPANNVDLTISGSRSFKYKSDLVGKTANAAGGNSFVKNLKIAFPLKCLSSFWR